MASTTANVMPPPQSPGLVVAGDVPPEMWMAVQGDVVQAFLRRKAFLLVRHRGWAVLDAVGHLRQAAYLGAVEVVAGINAGRLAVRNPVDYMREAACNAIRHAVAAEFSAWADSLDDGNAGTDEADWTAIPRHEVTDAVSADDPVAIVAAAECLHRLSLAARQLVWDLVNIEGGMPRSLRRRRAHLYRDVCAGLEMGGR